MTYNEFLEILEKTTEKFNWNVTNEFSIRATLKDETAIRKEIKTENIDFCPLTAVYYYLTSEFKPLTKVEEVSIKLGLESETTDDIVLYADYNYETIPTRKSLIRVLRL